MTTTSFPTADLPRRLAALVYDTLLIMALAMSYGALFLALKHQVFHIELAQGERANIGPAGFAGLILLIEVFFWYFWCHGGQTLGMRAWRLKLVAKSGSPVQWHQALVRGLIAPFSLSLLGLGFLHCLWSKQSQTWHDLASRTRVELLPKIEK